MDSKDILGQEVMPINNPSSDEKTMALLSHVLTLILSFIAPLVIYLVKKDESAFVTEHAKESLNFQITMFLIYIVCFILVFLIVGIFLFMIAGLLHTVLVIVATIKAAEGKLYRYPINLRIVK